MGNSVLLMLSGGRDSFLAACKLLEDKEKYHIYMVTFDNGCIYQLENVRTVAERIIKRYGSDRAEYLGVYKTSSIAREFFFPYFNMKPAEQLDRFSGMTPSQFHCMICRTAMYVYAINLCKKHNIHYIAEGGRKSQQFVIELPGFAEQRYKQLVESQGLELLLPVYDMESDWERDNELMLRSFICKCMEAKCIIGVPINGSVDQSVIDGVHAYYDQIVLTCISERKLLENASAIPESCDDYDELYK